VQSEENQAPLSPDHAKGKSLFYNEEESQTKEMFFPKKRHRKSDSYKDQGDKPHSLDDINLDVLNPAPHFEVERRKAEVERRKLKYSKM